jgi:hypothetical protein
MKRIITCLAGLASFGLLAGFVACSGGDDAKIDSGPADTGVKDTGTDCGPTNVATLHCREGEPGKACGSLDQAPVKVDPGMYCSMFKCAPGFTELKNCACNAESQKVDAGADCPGGSQDSGATD